MSAFEKCEPLQVFPSLWRWKRWSATLSPIISSEGFALNPGCSRIRRRPEAPSDAIPPGTPAVCQVVVCDLQKNAACLHYSIINASDRRKPFIDCDFASLGPRHPVNLPPYYVAPSASRMLLFSRHTPMQAL